MTSVELRKLNAYPEWRDDDKIEAVIQSFILLSLLGGLFTPPRRAKDFTDFKVKNIIKTKDDYMDKNQMVFNSFTTHINLKEAFSLP